MTAVILLTCDFAAHGADTETALLAQALTESGIDTQIVSWSSPDLLDLSADLMLIRSTWDYSRRLPEFLDVLRRVSVPIANPLTLVEWNSHKGYLLELAGAGVPVVPTTVHLAGTPATLTDFGSTEIIVKPAVSAGADGIGKFLTDSEDARLHLTSILDNNDALTQPFLPEIADGERSLVYLGGHYSHSVRKVPGDNDFRVQSYLGGTDLPHQASRAELAVADAALNAAPIDSKELLYARVDLVGSHDNPRVMELELIEPELFLRFDPSAVQKFAGATARRATSQSRLE